MTYSVETTRTFDKQFKKLDKGTQFIVKKWIDKHLIICDDPRSSGKSLLGNKKGYWRYRIGDYRLICIIQDNKLIITALNIGHRREIYKS